MTAMLTAAHSEMTSRPLPHDSCSGRGIQLLTKEEFDRVLRALEIPFEANLVQWRVTERSDDDARGLMMAYADPRAYSDRLNSLFTPAGWTRRYTVRARKKPRPASSFIWTVSSGRSCQILRGKPRHVIGGDTQIAAVSAAISLGDRFMVEGRTRRFLCENYDLFILLL